MSDLPNAFCAGLMVFRVKGSRIEYLMLKASQLKNHWTPPKGHINPGETEFNAAQRETLEESGLTSQDYEIIPGFSTNVHYEARNTNKYVSYWPAKLKDSNTQVIISDEHVAFRWCDIECLAQICTRDSTTHAYRKLEHFLREKFFKNGVESAKEN